MAQDVKINNTNYSLVPSINVPQQDAFTVGTQAQLNQIVGGTIAWCQLCSPPSSISSSGGVTYTCNNGLITMTGTCTTSANKNVNTGRKVYKGHKYLLMSCGPSFPISSSNVAHLQIYYSDVIALTVAESGYTNYAIGEASATGSATIRLRQEAGVTYNLSTYLLLFDLTYIFGPTIADYVYTQESSTKGTGFALVKPFIQKNFYPYVAYADGYLVSVNTSALITRSNEGGLLSTTSFASTDLRGVFQLSNNKIVADGDIYPASGSATRKYAIVDMGSLEWTYNTSYATPIFTTPMSTLGAKLNSGNGVCAGYIPKADFWSTSGNDMCMYGSGTNYVFSNNGYSSANAFKTAMTGKYLVYEKASSTPETLTSYTALHDIAADGTEEFVDTRDIAVPVGHSTVYYASGSSGTSVTDTAPFLFRRAGNALAKFADCSNASATPAKVVSGESYYDKSGNAATGTMTNVGAMTGFISTKAQQYPIPAGYHNGSGYIGIKTAEQNKIIADNIKSGITILGQAGSPTVKDVSDTTATAADVMTSKDFYLADGTKTTGTITYPVNMYAFNPTLVRTDTLNIEVGDCTTSVESITTSATQMKVTTNWYTQTLNTSSYDYILEQQNWTQIIYEPEFTFAAGAPRICAQTGLYYIGKTPSASTGLGTYTYNNIAHLIMSKGYLYYWSSGSAYSRLDNNGYGFYINTNATSLSSTTSNTPTLTCRYNLYARCHATYFKTDYLGEINTDSTIYHLTTKLYQVEKTNNFGGEQINTMLLDLLKEKFDSSLHS